MATLEEILETLKGLRENTNRSPVNQLFQYQRKYVYALKSKETDAETILAHYAVAYDKNDSTTDGITEYRLNTTDDNFQRLLTAIDQRYPWLYATYNRLENVGTIAPNANVLDFTQFVSGMKTRLSGSYTQAFDPAINDTETHLVNMLPANYKLAIRQVVVTGGTNGVRLTYQISGDNRLITIGSNESYTDNGVYIFPAGTSVPIITNTAGANIGQLWSAVVETAAVRKTVTVYSSSVANATNMLDGNFATTTQYGTNGEETIFEVGASGTSRTVSIAFECSTAGVNVGFQLSSDDDPAFGSPTILDGVGKTITGAGYGTTLRGTTTKQYVKILFQKTSGGAVGNVKEFFCFE